MVLIEKVCNSMKKIKLRLSFLQVGGWELKLLREISCSYWTWLTCFSLLVLTVNCFLFSQTDSSEHWQCICAVWSGYSSVLLIYFLLKGEQMYTSPLVPGFVLCWFFVYLSGCKGVLQEIWKWQSASDIFGKKSRERGSSQDGN